MSQPNTELEAWLAGGDILDTSLTEPEDWLAGFDPDRQLVLLKLGPFQRLYVRPEKFSKRFYHQLYPLKIESWPYRRQIKLFEDFCTIDVALDLRFQATLQYVQRNIEVLEAINQHIQALYAAVIEDKINQELVKLADGAWVRNGLTTHEKRIAISVCEVFTQQHIQAEAICHMTASFVDFPEVQLGKDSVYLHVLTKTYELNEQKNQEIQRQQCLNQQQALAAKQQELEHLKQMAEMQRQVQLAEAEAQIQLLQDKEQQVIQQREVERRIHAEQVKHEQQLREMTFEIERQAQQELEARQRLAELQQTSERLAHQTLLEDKATLAEIERKRMAEQRWREAGLYDGDTRSDDNVTS